jgi:hypothetical protein
MAVTEKKPYQLSDYLNAINNTKEDLMDTDDPGWKKKYPGFIVNKCMSYHIDTLLEANTMNGFHHLPNDMQFNFYINIVRPKKRFSKWYKSSITNIDVVKKYYGYTYEKARQALNILDSEQIKRIKSIMEVGGRRK